MFFHSSLERKCFLYASEEVASVGRFLTYRRATVALSAPTTTERQKDFVNDTYYNGEN